MVKQAPDSEFLRAEPGISPRQGDPIHRGLNFLSAKWNGTGWGQPASKIWLTAYVLSRLGELAPGVLDHALGQKIRVSCEWLLSSRTAEGRWNDPATTAYSVSALRSLGRHSGPAVLEALERSLLANCGNMASQGTPFAAALAVKATGKALPVTCEALEAALEQTGTQESGLSQLLLCAEILDWPPELVPQPLSLGVSEVVE